MRRLSDVFKILNRLVADGVISEYAVGGAIAALFYAEPVDTQDLDVFILLPQSESGSGILLLGPLYSWLQAHGFVPKDVFVDIYGVPTQFLISPGKLGDEAVKKARSHALDGVPVRVIAPEYLVAMWLEGSAASAKRVTRAAMLLEAEVVDRGRLKRILQKHRIPKRGLKL